MSKYALKLEQLVQTDHYGDILVTIQYDGTGPKLVTANGEGIDADLKHALDTFLGFVNFTLSKGIPVNEIAVHLETEPQDGIHLPLNDLLMVIAASLKELPEAVNEIDASDLMEVLPEMVKEFTENATGSVSPMPSQAPSADGNKDSNFHAFRGGNQEQPQTPENKEDDKKGFFGGFSK